MGNYDQAYAKTISAKNSSEGGYANIAGDKGKETYMGVSRKYWPNWRGWIIIDAYKASKGKIPYNFRIPDVNLEKAVKEFYHENFWNVIKGDKIKSQGIAENFFDMHVNSSKAVKIMQGALNRLGFKLAVDNAMGTDTLNAINKANPEILNQYYLEGRKAHYDALVAEDPSQAKFYDGWMNRLKHFPTATAAAGISTTLLLFGSAGLVYYFFF